MKTWKRDIYDIVEARYDGDLNKFDIVDKNGDLIEEIIPDNWDDYYEIEEALDAGEDPLRQNWENGMGVTLHIGMVEDY